MLIPSVLIYKFFSPVNPTCLLQKQHINTTFQQVVHNHLLFNLNLWTWPASFLLNVLNQWFWVKLRCLFLNVLYLVHILRNRQVKDKIKIESMLYSLVILNPIGLIFGSLLIHTFPYCTKLLIVWQLALTIQSKRSKGNSLSRVIIIFINLACKIKF
jgi:hypothetical protein